MRCHLVIDGRSVKLSEAQALMFLRLLGARTYLESDAIVTESIVTSGTSITALAREAGVCTKTIYNKMKRYDL